MSWPSYSSAPSSSLSALPPGTTAYANWQRQPPHVETQSSPPSSLKRTRITRACDVCKKKKIKCDADSCFPCTTCQQYEWDCTFNETSRKRGPPKGYIGGLEARLERMEQLLCKIQGNDPGNGAQTTSLSQSYDRTTTTSPTLTENSTPPSLDDSLTDQLSRNSSLSSKGKVVRYLGSSSGLYLVNDILRNHTQRSNTADRSLSLASSSPSPSTAMYTSYRNDHPTENGTIGGSSAHGTVLPGNRSSVLKSPVAGNKSKPPHVMATTTTTTALTPSTYDNSFTSLKTNQGTCRLRRVNGVDDDLVMVRDETDDETKVQAEAANEQEIMDSIVPRSILASLVKVYFDADCKTLPILDQQEFMDSFEGKTTPPPAPLLTYAICSYACFLMPSDHSLFTQSSLSRDDIYQALIDRAGIFMRSEYLIPKIQTIQALVLLCAHPTCASISNRNWVLAGMAVRMAQDLGLHRLLTNYGCTADILEKRRRLWYSVYLTDRWCCCVLGRPSAITDSDCDVDLPSVDAVNQPGKHTKFVNLVKLSGILGEVLRRIYSSKAKSLGYGTHIMEQTVWSLDKMLKEWFAQVPPEYLITPEQLQGMKGVEHTYGDRFRMGGPLTVCYYAVVILLFRPFLIFESCKHHSSKLFDDAPKRCMDAAANSIDVARHIPKEQIPRFGWNFAAYSVFQATVMHVYNSTNTDTTIAQRSRNYTRIAIGECVAPICEDIPFGPPILQFLKILIHWSQADASCDLLSSPPTKALDSTTTAVSHDKPNTSGNSLESTESNLFSSTDVPYSFGSSSTAYIPSSTTAHQLVNDSILTTNLLSSILPSDIYTSNPMDFINSITTQDTLLQNQPFNPMTQASWRMLFSSAGAPFTNSSNNGSDFNFSAGDSNFGL